MATNRWLLLIVVIGAALRFFPVWFGFPYLARPDEEVSTRIALRVLAGDPNPHFFHWPSLTFYLFAGVFWLVERFIDLRTANYFLVGRIVVAIAGTVTIPVLFKMTRRVAGDTTALLAAAFLAVAILHVRDSHFAMTDVLMTLFATASLAMVLCGIDQADIRRSMGPFAAAGFAAGLAASTKYNGAAVVTAMLAAQILILLRERRIAALLPSISYLVLFTIAFVAGTPYAILDFPKFKEDVIFDIAHLSEGHGIDLGRGWVYHLTQSLTFGLGPFTTAAAVIGVIPFVVNGSRYAVVLGTFWLALYISIGSGYTVFFRYILPLIPLTCIAAAAGARVLVDRLSGEPSTSTAGFTFPRRWRLTREAAWWIVLAVTVGPGVLNSIWFDASLARTDSRVLAARWLIPRLQPHHSLYDAGGGYSSLDLRRAEFDRWDYEAESSSFERADGQVPDWLVLYQSPLYGYTRMPVHLQTLAQTRYRKVYTMQASNSARRHFVYDWQDAFFLPVWGLWGVERPGPNVHIYLRNELPLEGPAHAYATPKSLTGRNSHDVQLWGVGSWLGSWRDRFSFAASGPQQAFSSLMEHSPYRNPRLHAPLLPIVTDDHHNDQSPRACGSAAKREP